MPANLRRTIVSLTPHRLLPARATTCPTTAPTVAVTHRTAAAVIHRGLYRAAPACLPYYPRRVRIWITRGFATAATFALFSACTSSLLAPRAAAAPPSACCLWTMIISERARTHCAMTRMPASRSRILAWFVTHYRPQFGRRLNPYSAWRIDRCVGTTDSIPITPRAAPSPNRFGTWTTASYRDTYIVVDLVRIVCELVAAPE